MKKMDTKARIMLAVHRIFHPKIYTDRLQLSRRKGAEKFDQLPGLYEAVKIRLGWYIRNAMELLLKYMKKVSIINTENCVTKKI